MKNIIYVLFLVLPFGLTATTFSVTNLNDSGPGSLRQAILDANIDNSFSPTHEIVFSITGQIDLQTALEDINNPTDFIGHANGNTIHRAAGGDYRILTFSAAGSLESLIISNGASPDDGGGILAEVGFSMTNCMLVGNTALNGDGGGLYKSNSSGLTLTNCTFKNNTANAGNGGGVYSATGILMFNNTFFGNQCTGSGLGGGMYVASSALIYGNTFANNTAAVDGGGAYLASGTHFMEHNLIANNSPNDYDSGAGSFLVTNTNNLVEQTGPQCFSCSWAFTTDPNLGSATACGFLEILPLQNGSIAIDPANPGIAVISPDPCGTVREALPDIGAIEYSNAATVVPTMGEWTFILFALILLSLSTIYVMKWNSKRAAQNFQIMKKSILFFLISCVSMGLFAQINNGLAFDGSNDYISGSIATNGPTTTQSITFEAWIYPFSSPPIAGAIAAKYQNGNANSNFFVIYNGTNNKIQLSGKGSNVLFSDSTVPQNEWTHVAVVFGNGNTKIYLNGVLDQTGSLTYSTAVSTIPFTVGQIMSPTSSNRFKGIIDEVRVWNGVRTDVEIGNYMNCELDGTEAGLEVYYNLNQGIANANNAGVNSATDLSPNGYNGSLQNFSLNGGASNWVAGATAVSGICDFSIPTMGEWSLLIFGLILLSLSTIYVMKWQDNQQLLNRLRNKTV